MVSLIQFHNYITYQFSGMWISSVQRMCQTPVDILHWSSPLLNIRPGPIAFEPCRLEFSLLFALSVKTNCCQGLFYIYKMFHLWLVYASYFMSKAV